MTRRRRTLLAGLALACLLLAVSIRSVDLPRVIVVPLVSVLVLGSLTIWAIRGPLSASSSESLDVDPESPLRFSVPGAGLDRELSAESRRFEREESHARKRIRERIEEVAIEVVCAYGRRTREEAIDDLEAGTWTDDPVAAAFLRGEMGGASSRLRDRLASSSPFLRGVRRTVAALTRYTGRTPPNLSAGSLRDRFRAVLPDVPISSEEDRFSASRDGVRAGASGERSLGTWDGMVALSIASLGAGLILADPGVLLAGGIGVGYLAFARGPATPQIALDVERSVEDATPTPGEDVRVTLSVRNEGERVLPDLRIVDGVPPGLAVEAGSPRVATPLRPGEEVTLSYAVRARRGVHEFDPLRVAVRDVAETRERTEFVSEETAIVCRPRLDSTEGSLRREATRYVGAIPTERGGDGVEFHSVREYRRGDPVSRIDWKRLARTRDLATVAFREERAASVVCVVDARASAYVAPDPLAESACDRGIDALRRLFPAFLDSGNRVGLAAFAPEPCWIAPSAAREVRTRVREAVTAHPAFPVEMPDGRCYTLDWIEEFRRRHDAVQVVFFTPLLDEGARLLARRLEVHGYPTTVVSVDPTVTDSAGTQLAYLERQARIHDLREAGVRIVDWDWAEPLDLALAAAERRWSP